MGSLPLVPPGKPNRQEYHQKKSNSHILHMDNWKSERILRDITEDPNKGEFMSEKTQYS